MPKGVYPHKHGGGRKPSCMCGTCRKCKMRTWDKTKYNKRKRSAAISDEELERRLNARFGE